jgi:hypothetical protein
MARLKQTEEETPGRNRPSRDDRVGFSGLIATPLLCGAFLAIVAMATIGGLATSFAESDELSDEVRPD